jgi:hypothetical protein
MGSVVEHEKAESVKAARCCTKSQPLRLNFVMSPYNTVQRMIRFSDGKASFVFLFFGSILSIFDIQGDRVLLILGGQIQARGFRALFILVFLLFLMTIALSSLCALQTIVPDSDPFGTVRTTGDFPCATTCCGMLWMNISPFSGR